MTRREGTPTGGKFVRKENLQGKEQPKDIRGGEEGKRRVRPLQSKGMKGPNPVWRRSRKEFHGKKIPETKS